MSSLLFRLRHVPEEEAAAIRALLDRHQIDWYETSAGNWGIAMPGIWVSRDEDLPQARELIETWQREHAERARQARVQAQREGTAITFARRLREQPLKVIGIMMFCLFIVYVMVSPFLRLIDMSAN